MKSMDDLVDYIETTLPDEPRQDVLWRHAILARQTGQFIGVAITHHPELTPDARPMTGLDEAGSDLLVQTLYTLVAAGVDIDQAAQQALERMKDRVWEKSTSEGNIDGHPTGILAHPWPVAEEPLVCQVAWWEDSYEGEAVLLMDHLDNTMVPGLRRVHEAGGVVAVVTEHGGMLSHAANVCREWGIPCVVGVGELDIETGELVELHADLQTQRAWVEAK